MKTIAKNFFKSGFKSNLITVEASNSSNGGKTYTLYQKSVSFWIPIKSKIVVCSDIEELREVNKRCKLGLKI